MVMNLKVQPVLVAHQVTDLYLLAVLSVLVVMNLVVLLVLSVMNLEVLLDPLAMSLELL